MNPSRGAAFTWVEVLVVLGVLSVLGYVAWSTLVRAVAPCRATQVLSNMKQLHLVTQQMALDGVHSTNSPIGWPGDTGGSFLNWAYQLTNGYLSAEDLCKLLSLAGNVTPPSSPLSSNDHAILVYAIKDESDSATVFLTSANFTNTPAGGTALHASAKPYGNKGFAVFRKGGDGALLLPKQVGQTNLIGGYVPLCH